VNNEIIINGAVNKNHDFCFSVINQCADALSDIKIHAAIKQKTKHGLIEWTTEKPVRVLLLPGINSVTGAFSFSDFKDCGKALKNVTDKHSTCVFLIEYTRGQAVNKSVRGGNTAKFSFIK
jgi:hypothetical protein